MRNIFYDSIEIHINIFAIVLCPEEYLMNILAVNTPFSTGNIYFRGKNHKIKKVIYLA